MRRLRNFIRAINPLAQASTGKAVRSVATLEHARSQELNTDQSQFEQARAFHQQGLLNEADTLYKTLLQKHPKDFDLLHLLGMIQGQHGNFAAAIVFVEQAIAIDSANAATYCTLGNCLRGLGKHQEALASYDKALALRPNDADTLSNRGVTLHDLTRPREALDSYDKALALSPTHVLALDNRGAALRQLKRLEEALASHDKALAVSPDYAPAHYNRGLVLTELNRHEDARSSYERALILNPHHGEALRRLGALLGALSRHSDALSIYDRALALDPHDPVTHLLRGDILHRLGRHDDALASLEWALTIRPDYTEALTLRGAVLSELNRHEEALASFEELLKLNPDDAIVHFNYATVLAHLKRYEDSLTRYDRALILDPRYLDALYNRGVVLHNLKRYEDALASYGRALSLQPDHTDVLINQGATLRELHRYEDALAAFDRVLDINPDRAISHCSRGMALGDLKRFEEALACYDRALALQPDYLEAHNGRGAVLKELRRDKEALASYGKALAVNPDHVLTLFNRGMLLVKLKRIEDAIKDIERVVALEPNYDFAQGYLLSAKATCCDWRDWAALSSAMAASVQLGEKSAEPFCCIGISNSPQVMKRCAEIYTAAMFRPSGSSLQSVPPRKRDKIRLGYVAGEFRKHATSYLLAGLFESHDTSRFEVFAFDNGWDDGSEMRKRLERSFTQIVDISRLGDWNAANAIRDTGIDILVDLNGLVGLKRTGIFSYKPAPVQVNWLGFPGTVGADYIDYIIGDAIIIPVGDEAHYCEKVVRMPDTYQVNDRKRAIAANALTRAQARLPDAAFVFCCFNNNYKITPDVFDIWMRLLNRVEHSVLWLLEDNTTASRNLRSEAAARGVAPTRLIFAPRMDLQNHLERQRLADLFLDTVPCNAHTTASDALWAGLPLVTCMGSTFAGRVAGSLLNAVGLPELVTENLHDYEALALKLATTPALLCKLRTRLASNRTTYPLFDTDRFRRHIEAAYTTMYECWLRGQPPSSFSVQAMP